MAGRKYDGARLIDLSKELDRPLAIDLNTPGITTLDIRRYRDYIALFEGKDEVLNASDLLKIIAQTEADRFALETLGNAFTPFTIDVGVTPTRILPPNKSPRGYLFLNPSQSVTGATLNTNLFTPAVRGAATYTSATINVQAHRTSRFYLNISVSPVTLVVNIETQDPQTGLWAVAQSDIFGGVVAIGTYYANIGEIGTDDFIRAVVVQTGAGANWSLTMINKEAFGAIVAAPGIFLGNANVTATIGYPILGGQEKRFWLMDNTPLFGVALAATQLKVFQLQ